MGELCLYDQTMNMILIRLTSYTVKETEIGRLIDCPLTKKYAQLCAKNELTDKSFLLVF